MAARTFPFGPFVLDPGAGTLRRDGVPVSIGQRAFALLSVVLQADQRVVSKAELMDAAWPGLAVEESNLSVQIAALRKILGPAPGGGEWISTVPRIGYRFAGPSCGSNAAPGASEAVDPGRPSIAVLPFTNISGDPAQDYLADGISEDIITALSQFRWFFVIARNSSFVFRGRSAEAPKIAQELGVRYLLDGSVRRSGQRIRISANLIDATAASHLWAQRYDLEMADVFAVQDDLAERIVGAIEPELLRSESAPLPLRHTGNITAWELVRKGTWYFHQVTRPTHLKARELFRQACERDPYLTEAHLWLARASAGLVAYGWSETPAEDKAEGVEAGLRAVHLDDRNPYAHYALAVVSAYSDRLEQAVLAALEAVELSPSFALGHRVLGMARLFRGEAADAIAPLERGFRLCAHDPQNAVWLNLLALAYLFAGRLEDALDTTVRSMTLRPDWRPTHELRACLYVAAGRPDEVPNLVQQAEGLPVPPSDALDPLWKQNPHWQDRLASLLEAAHAQAFAPRGSHGAA